MGCLACGRGFHRECKKCRRGVCHAPADQITQEAVVSDESQSSIPKQRKSQNLLDPSSTGRKRAAEIYPLDRDAPCEWRGLRNCGGGRRPIIGCLDGTQKHRHHGPVKKTTRNEQGNVHRICVDCHVHWHELNDLVYDEREYNLLPHDPVEAKPEDIIQNKLDWLSGEMGRKYELASTKNREKHLAQTAVQPPSDNEADLGDSDSLYESLDEEDESGDVVS